MRLSESLAQGWVQLCSRGRHTGCAPAEVQGKKPSLLSTARHRTRVQARGPGAQGGEGAAFGRGYAVCHTRLVLGCGPDDFEAARDALLSWRRGAASRRGGGDRRREARA